MATELLVVNFDTKFYEGSAVRRYISYRGNKLDLTVEEATKILAELPTYWNTDKDKIIRFITFDSDSEKSYYCEREKEVFNYTHRTYETKIYKFEPETTEQFEALYTFFLEKYTKTKIDRANNIYNNILNEVNDLSYIKYSLLNSRDVMLKNSDYLMLPDYPIDEELRQKWQVFRQELRDLTEQKAWVENDLLNIVMPVSPDPLLQLSVLEENFSEIFTVPVGLTQDVFDFVREKIEQEDLETIVKQISSLTIKYEILKTLSKMRLPFLETNYNITETTEDVGNLYETLLKEIEADYTELSQSSEDIKTQLDNSLEKIETMVQNINENLKSYQIDFTINDILTAIVEKNKLSEEDLIAEQIIEEL